MSWARKMKDVPKVQFINSLFTISREEWTGRMVSDGGCPMPDRAWSQISSVASSYEEFARHHGLKVEGDRDDLLVAVVPDPRRTSQSLISVACEGLYDSYRVLRIEPGDASRLSTVWVEFTNPRGWYLEIVEAARALHASCAARSS